MKHRVTLIWLALGFIFTSLTFAFTIFSHNFGYDTRVIDMPIFVMVAGLCIAGLLFLGLLPLVKATIQNSQNHMFILAIIIVAGIIMRLTLFASEPVLEDDYQRYLWDGAVTAHSQNPYSYAPADITTIQIINPTFRKLVIEAGLVFGRINHPHLRTIYPPVAQAAFALAYMIEPFSLTAWRTLILWLDVLSLFIICKLLIHFQKSLLWGALYWWNPIVLKELFNSAHMEALLIPLVLTGVYLSLKARPLLATLCLTLAAGVKVWPVLLLPFIWRPLITKPKKAIAAIALSATLLTLFALPILLSGLTSNSGFVAYATQWQTNSLLFPLLKESYSLVLNLSAVEMLDANTLTRGLIIVCLAGCLLYLVKNSITDYHDLFARIAVFTLLIFMLSPAQFPWYYLWILPFLCLKPNGAFLLLSATLPLYYTSFYFISRGQREVFDTYILWVIWGPLLLTLLWQRKDQIKGWLSKNTKFAFKDQTP